MSEYRLAIKITGDSSQVVPAVNKVTDALTRIPGEADKAAQSLRRIGTSGKLADARDLLGIRSVHEIQRDISQIEAAYNRLARAGTVGPRDLANAHAAMRSKVEALRDEMNGLAGAAGRAGQAGTVQFAAMQTGADRLSAAIGRVSHYGLAGGGVWMVASAASTAATAIFAASASAERLATQLNFATGGKATQELAFTREVANRLGLEVGAVTKAYAGFAAAARGTALQGSGAREVFQAMATASAVMGLSADETSGALLAVQQMMSKGVVSAEEFRGQLGERMPIASEAAARALGVTTAEFSKMLESGQIVAEDFLPKFSRAMDEMLAGSAEQAAQRLDASIARMGNAWTALKQSVGDSGLSRFMAELADNTSADMDVVSQAIDRARRSGSGFFGQMNDGLGALIGRTLLLQGVSREFMTLDQAAADARATLAQLDAQERTQGKLSLLQLEQRATATRDLARANAELAASRGDAADGKAAQATQEGMRAQGMAREAYTRRQAEADAYLAELRGKLSGVNKEYGETLTRLQALREAGMVGEAEYVRLVSDLAEKNYKAGQSTRTRIDVGAQYLSLVADLLGAERGLASNYNEQLATLAKGYAATSRNAEATDTYRRAVEALIARQPFAVQAAKEAADAEKAWADARAKRFAEVQAQADADARAAGQSATAAEERLQALRDEQDAAALAAFMNVTLSEAVEELRVARLLEARAAALASGDQERVDAINREIAARRELAREKGRQDGQAAVAAYLQDPTAGLSAGWDRVTQSIGGTVSAMLRLGEMQVAYDAAVRGAAGNQDQLARIELQRAQQQAGAYATLIGAAKGLFKEHTAGYKLMAGAEKAYRAYQIAAAVASAAREMGLISAVTAAKVMGVGTQAGAVVAGQATETAAVTAGEAARNTAKVPGVFMAFMSALGPWGMAAAGVAIAAVLGGAFGGRSGQSMRATATGTGTVKGDSSAVSESVSKSIDRLADVDTMTMRYSAQMLASLRAIETSLAGVSSLIVRTNGLDASAVLGRIGGIQTGTQVSSEGKAEALAARAALAWVSWGGSEALGFGSALQRTIGRMNSTSTSVRGYGIYDQPQTLAEIMEGGYDTGYFANVRRTTRRFGIKTRTRDSIRYGGRDEQLSDMLGDVILDMADSLAATGETLGLSAALVGERLADFVVDLDNIDLKGLSGQQLEEKLSAAFSKLGDQMASTALAGFEAFARTGEGYYETIVRVASGTEVARHALSNLGVKMVSLADVTNQQGDVAAELVRDSLIAVETTRAWDAATKQVTATVSGIGEVLQTLDGSAAELREAYLGLTAVRSAFRGLGLSADAVGRDLLSGAGGLQALADGVSSYEENFATAPERIAARSETLREQFARLGLALPATADAYRALVRGIDTSTASGRELLGQVLTLSDGMRELLDAVQDTTGGIADEIERIRGLMAGGGTTGQGMAQLQARFAIQAAQARAGDAAALADLPAASKALLDAAADQIGSRADLVRLQASTAASLQGVLDSVQAAALAPASAVQTPATPAAPTALAPVAPPAQAAADPALQDMLAELQRLRAANERQAEQARERDQQLVELQQAVASATAQTARILADITPNGTAIAIAPEREYGA